MATYPIKLLKDESGIPFVPLTQVNAVIGKEYILSTFAATQLSTGHFQITNNKMDENDIADKVIAVIFPEDITATTNSYLKFNEGTEYLIQDETGTGPLLVNDYAGSVCFLIKRTDSWQFVKTGTSGGSGGGHSIVDGDGNVLTQRAVLKFEGFGVSDDASIGATVISTPALVNNLTTSESNTGPLDAYQGYVLNNKIDTSLAKYLPLAGGTITGHVSILGTAAAKPLQVRGIVGSNAEGTAVDELHLQYQANMPIKLGNDAAYSISADGGSYTGNAATATILKTARTLTIGNTGKSFDGSGNVSWSLSEIGAASSSHTHGTLSSDFTVYVDNTTTDSGWSMIQSGYSNTGFILKSVRYQQYAPAWSVGDYGAGICFGGGDTKGIISHAYGSPYIKFAGGNGSKPVWYISVTGTSGTNYNLNGISSKTTTFVQSSTPTANRTGDIWFVT